jgi:transposase
MDEYAGIDVSLEASAVCIVDAEGRIVKERKVASAPEALVAFFRALEARPARIGLEAGPLSQWLYAGLKAAGLPVQLIETRQVRDAFKSMPVKTDRGDARGIAQLMRMGWFKPVHCKSPEAQEMRALLSARALLREKRHDVEMSLRGLLRGFGLKVGKTTPKTYPARVRELAEGNARLVLVAEALLAAREALEKEFAALDKRLRQEARADGRARLLMSAPGVGPVVALSYASAIDDPSRLASSRNAGAYFGLTPRRYQSGEKDIAGRISKCGDMQVRALLYEAAHVILTRPVKGGALKSWGLRLAKRIGLKKASVALARKLAVILHRMLADGTKFDMTRGAVQI